MLTLGCPKNSADSERLAGILARAGFEMAEEPSDSDVVVLNTCGFVQSAVEEGVNAILELEEMKAKGQISAFGVVGCLVNRYGDELKKEFPTADYWAKSEEWEKLVLDMGAVSLGDGRHILTRTPWTRYLKVSEGCNCSCSYCAIPSIRGPLRSRTKEEIWAEAEALIAEGAQEICLVGQELTDYGSDLYRRRSLTDLLDGLEERLPQGKWLRLFYLHPSHLDFDLLRRVAESDKIVPWLDVPIQHVDDTVLRRMARPPVEEHIRQLFVKGRQLREDFAFRTTVMVGFPGETEEQFKKLLDFVEATGFDRLGAFTYSPEEGTPAASFPDQVPEEVKQERFDRLMSLQQQVSLRRGRAFVGRQMDVLVEEVGDDGSVTGRTFRDAPEIDGVMTVYDCQAKPGQFIKALVEDSDEYDLYGREVKE